MATRSTPIHFFVFALCLWGTSADLGIGAPLRRPSDLRGLKEHWHEEVEDVLRTVLDQKGLVKSKNVSALCRSHWTQVLEEAKSETYAMNMLDSSDKLPPGVLFGALTHLGNWEECVKIRDISAVKNTLFHGQMCLLKLSMPNANSLSVRKMFHMERDDAEEWNAVALRVAKCVPSSCSAQDVQTAYSVGEGAPLRLSVSQEECTTLDRPEWEPVDWVAVGVLSCLAAVMALSTAYDVMQRAKSRRPHAVLASFSVYSNGKKLLAMPSTTADATLGCVHGLRFVSMMWVVLGHRYIVNMGQPIINSQYILDFVENWTRGVISNGTMSVDTFFVLSGLLVAYIFMREVEAKGKFHFVMFYVHRYVRLTPALACMVLLHASLLCYVAWGPMWTTTVAPIREGCKTNWWNTLLYVNNYVDPQLPCIEQGWYLMVDMQLYWLSPLVLIPLWKWRFIGIILMCLLSLGGVICDFVISYHYNIPGNAFLIVDEVTFDAYLRHLYESAYARFVPYLIGIALGYYVAIMKVKGEKPRFPWWAKSLLWLAAAGLMLGSLFGGTVIFQEDHEWSRVGNAFYNSLSRPAWSLGVALVVYLCATGNGCFVNSILSWWGFQVLGRLSYCVYLVHAAVQVVQMASVRTYTFMSDTVTLPQFCGDLTLSLLAAFALSVACESPFLALEKALLGQPRQPNEETSTKIAP